MTRKYHKVVPPGLVFVNVADAFTGEKMLETALLYYFVFFVEDLFREFYQAVGCDDGVDVYQSVVGIWPEV